MTDEQIFKAGSTTYYWSSKFFPKSTRQDVFKLYSFVRVADNFVDELPQDKKSFDRLVRTWHKLAAGKTVRTKKDDVIIRVCHNMYDVYKKYDFEAAWVDAFLDAMRKDVTGYTYKTMDDTIAYMYGSAEVIGLMMAKILNVKQTAYKYAQLQGRAMQYINFIRDIAEDIELGRCYIPRSELRKYGIAQLDQKAAQTHPAAFRECIEAQIAYYHQWQNEANKGFKAIPRRQRIALRTAVDMYNWTALTLAADPFVVFDKKVKPSKFRVVARAIIRIVHA